jgi:ABC-type tungstate transport system permease subunit
VASNGDRSPDGIDDLTDEVKSRILDRVIADLRDSLKLGSRASGYTKSDSGIYGKYQKQDVVDMSRVLAAVKAETERLLAEYRAAVEKPGEDDGEDPRRR